MNMEEVFEIKRVLLRTDGVKYVIIPKLSAIKAGDYVMINKVKHKEV